MTNCNIKHRTIFCKDNLDILEGINNECIDLIYLDPPFNKKKTFTAPIGSSAEGASFSDIFREEDVKDEWIETIKEDEETLFSFLNGVREIGNHYNFCYLCYMAIRIIEMRRILKDTGSLYLHCDQTMSHYLKLLLDIIFGEDNFRNEIIWCYSSPAKRKIGFTQKHDTILYYAKSSKHTFNLQRIEHKSGIHGKGGLGFRNTEVKSSQLRELEEKGKLLEDWWIDISPAGRIVKEVTGYPTQKPLALLDRIIKASSNKGDMVLDPFCGCATTCIASELQTRKWIGIDVSVEAYNLVKKRLEKEVKKDLFDPEKEVNFSTDTPQRTDKQKDYILQKDLYVISHPKYKGEYKVGISNYAENRLNQYQTSDPKPSYKLEYKLRTPHFRKIEKYIHNKFENSHEWVKGNLKDIIKEIQNHSKRV